MATSSSSSSSSPEKLHRSLLSDLQSDFLGEKVDDNRTFQKWKQFLKLVYEGPRYQDTSVFDDFNQLEKDGKLGVGEYGILKKILKHVDQRAVTKVEETEKDIKKLREIDKAEKQFNNGNEELLERHNRLEQNIMSYEEELETLDPIEFYFRQPKYQDSKLPEEIELLYFDHSNIDPKCVQDLFGKLTLKKNPERVEFPSVDIDTLTEPQGLTLAPSGHLVFSDGDSTLVEKQILIHDSTRNKLNIITRKLKKFQDYEMWGIFCTKNGEYLICLIPYPSAKSEKLFAKVVKLNQDGQQQEFRQDEQGKVLFSKPRFVCENKLTSDICVSDIENMVIVLEKNGKFRGRYNGRLPSSCKDPFAPRGIDSDSLGNILVADVNNDFVHLLDKDVQFITHILSSINPVLQPWGLHVDYKDRVWVVERNNHKGFEKKYATVRAFQIHIKTVTEKGALSLDLL
ncbi:uncharacterized protein LOC134250029 [Saccostrea cucullata]|uniref:uncharacterized protein LOC134250029 n=1 Tax=Saccostrea cuccullata TaxID=36930 RepID=UPI002ED3C0A6